MNKSTYIKRKLTGAVLAILITLSPFPLLHAFAGANIPVTIDIPITYIVDGNAETAGGDTFVLTADDPLSPMPDGTVEGEKSIRIGDEGTYSFGDLHFEKPGVHWYTVTRNESKKKGVNKDDSVFKVKVIALNDGHGYVLAYRNGSDEKSELVYVDRVAPETGDGDSLIIYAILVFAAAAGLAAFAVSNGMNRKKEVHNGSGKRNR